MTKIAWSRRGWATAYCLSFEFSSLNVNSQGRSSTDWLLVAHPNFFRLDSSLFSRLNSLPAPVFGKFSHSCLTENWLASRSISALLHFSSLSLVAWNFKAWNLFLVLQNRYTYTIWCVNRFAPPTLNSWFHTWALWHSILWSQLQIALLETYLLIIMSKYVDLIFILLFKTSWFQDAQPLFNFNHSI